MATEAGLRAFIDLKLASESEIIASEHREVENAIIDYLIQENEFLQTQIDELIANPPESTAFIRKGTRIIGDVPQDALYVVNFDDIGTTNYMVLGSIVGAGANFNDDNDVMPSIRNKTSSSFSINIRSISSDTQNISFDYAIILF